MDPPGHFGVAFAVKPLAPRAPLWALLLASEALDMLCFGFAAAGIENMDVSESSLAHGVRVLTTPSLAWSHGLFMSLVWSALAAGLAWIAWRDRRASALIGLVVFSHWLLDFLVHPRYLPLFFAGSPALGLGLWGSGPGIIAAAVLEIGLFVGGVVIYLAWRKENERNCNLETIVPRRRAGRPARRPRFSPQHRRGGLTLYRHGGDSGQRGGMV